MNDWTERPHWVVRAFVAGESECIGHHPTRALADKQAHRKRRTHNGPMQGVTVEPTAGDTPEQAMETERAYKAAEGGTA
jgi:hypothetical protein